MNKQQPGVIPAAIFYHHRLCKHNNCNNSPGILKFVNCNGANISIIYMNKNLFFQHTGNYASPVCEFRDAFPQGVFCTSPIPPEYTEGGGDHYEDEDIIDNGDY